MNDTHPFIIPVFTPYAGCGHRCAFCNQTLTGEAALGRDVVHYVRESTARAPAGRVREVAFYGGSFTALRYEELSALLNSARMLKEDGVIDRIRISTRPDGIDEQRVAMLVEYRVDTVELGVQSMNDDALTGVDRGHTSADSRRAIGLLREAGLAVGIHLMIGLPGEDISSTIRGARELVSLGPAFVRIHPLVVLADTKIEQMYRKGEFFPLPLDQAVLWSYAVKRVFEDSGITVIRVGLQQTDRMIAGGIVAGPFHSAFGELVDSLDFFHRIRRRAGGKSGEGMLTIAANPRDISKIVGYRRTNFRAIESLFAPRTVTLVNDSSISPGEFSIVNH